MAFIALTCPGSSMFHSLQRKTDIKHPQALCFSGFWMMDLGQELVVSKALPMLLHRFASRKPTSPFDELFDPMIWKLGLG
jgi:hypothetical protein